MDTNEKSLALICSARQMVLHLFSAFPIRVYPWFNCSLLITQRPVICSSFSG
jgi:hypothetical protein